MVNIRRIKRSVFQNFGIASFIGDFILLNGFFLLALNIRYDAFNSVQEKDIRTLILFINMSWFAMMYFGQFYLYSRDEPIERTLGKNVKYVFYLTIIGFSLTEVLHFHTISRLVHIYFFSLFLVGIFIFRLTLIKIIKGRRRRGKNDRYIVVVGGKATSNSIAAQLSSDEGSGYKIIGVFNNQKEDLSWEDGRARWTGVREDLLAFLKSRWVDELYFPINEITDKEFHDIIKLCERKFIRIKMLPNLNKFTMKHKVGIEFYGNIPVFAFIRTPLQKPLSRIIKRTVDIVISLIVLLGICSWFFPIVMLIIKLGSKGSAIFRQERSGINNRAFLIYKFRSMEMNEDSDSVQATKNDPRVTKFGSFMRKTNIDELPQFYNVLIGDMSIVGPRPHMLKHTADYSALISEYLERHYILPGITGWAQVHGFRGETKKLSQMEKRVEHDIWYVEHWSLLLDIRILFLTVKNMFKGDKGAF